MSTKFKNIVLFTNSYPYGYEEETFLNKEMTELIENFDNIYIIPYKSGEPKAYKLNRNKVTIINDLEKPEYKYKKNVKSFFELFLIKKILINEFITCSNKKKYIKNIISYTSVLLRALCKAKFLNSILINHKIPIESTIFYTYWFGDFTTSLGFLRSIYPEYKQAKFISRAHGWDLYEYRHKSDYIFPRTFQLEKIDHLFLISKNGMDYISKKYPFAKDKLLVSVLGTDNKFKLSEKINNVKNETDKELLIVSCANLLSVKRIHLIPQILKRTTKKIKWIHFGDGTQRNLVEEACKSLPGNISYVLKGFIVNDQIQQFYLDNYIDFFISTSYSEGLPVSMMEAISFGIPVIGTNVGGVSEIVTEDTGKLVERDFDFTDFAHLIETVSFNQEQRLKIIQFWEANYNAKRNFSQFALTIKNMKNI